ncbi:TPA: LysR family transcriptional regulator, partial [Burkholderia cenocepacia]
AIRSLERAKVPYRTSYESPSLLGLLSMVEAGLAVAPLARCAIPAQLSMLGRSHGLPDLPPLELILARSTKSKRPPCDFLAEQLMEDLQRQTGQTGDA